MTPRWMIARWRRRAPREEGRRPAAPTRPLYWSVRRELWEYRSIWLAPLAVAAVTLLAVGFHELLPPHAMPGVPAPGTGKDGVVVGLLYSAVATLLIMTGFLVGAFYSLDALAGERRDRSLLFWKSLPVSDLTAVLAKASVPLVVLPVIVLALIVASQSVMLAATGVLHLLGAKAFMAHTPDVPLLRMWGALLVALPVIALWQAPVYAWFLLVSAWARRAAFLWAVLPMAVAGVFERVVFGSARVAYYLEYRMVGWFRVAFPSVVASEGKAPAARLTPWELLASPGLWIGVLVAAAFLAAVRLRRERDPA